MKNLLTCIIFFCAVTLFAQRELAIGLNIGHTGENIYLKHNYNISPTAEAQFGLKYHINRYPLYDDNNYFYKAIDAANLREHIGLNCTLYKTINPKTEHTPFRLFYDLQFTNAKTKGVYLKLLQEPFYIRTDETHSTASILEQAIGLNLKLPVGNKINLFVSAGGSLAYIWNFETILAEKLGYFHTFETAFSISIGASFIYKQKEIKNKKAKKIKK